MKYVQLRSEFPSLSAHLHIQTIFRQSLCLEEHMVDIIRFECVQEMKRISHFALSVE